MSEHNCRICGFFLEDPPWGEDGKSPNYEFCPCCGVEFGHEDYTLASVLKYRKQWLDSGAAWTRPEEKPSGWNLAEQIKNIPVTFLK